MTRLLPRLSGDDRTAFIAAVRSLLTAWKGGPVRYRNQGRNVRGIDCVGVPIFGLSAIGHACEDLAGYSPFPDGVTLQANVEKHLGKPIPQSQWQPGDIVLMRWHENRQQGVVYCNHVGVLSGYTPYDKTRLTMLHSFAPERFVKELSFAGEWPRRAFAVYSLTGDIA